MNMADTPTRRQYDGWTCDCDAARSPRHRWRATKNTRLGQYELFSSSDAGQIIHRCGGYDTDGGTLYSENLY